MTPSDRARLDKARNEHSRMGDAWLRTMGEATGIRRSISMAKRFGASQKVLDALAALERDADVCERAADRARETALATWRTVINEVLVLPLASGDDRLEMSSPDRLEARPDNGDQGVSIEQDDAKGRVQPL